ncbi:MAG: hypothetical protein C4519_21505 [Desulfobacteraceae bacterium]|nr:MAG: hypothetical protein C4519_21505 [Desulfobacteraceae bacterium]
MDLDSQTARIARALREEHFCRTGAGWFRLLSNSMRPLIRAGDRVLVQRLGAADLKRGDIILFRTGADIAVTHRALKIFRMNDETFVLQKGDGGPGAGVIHGSCVVGRITVVQRNGKVIDLHTGWPRLRNFLLGVKNMALYRVEEYLFVLGKRLRQSRILGRLGFGKQMN